MPLLDDNAEDLDSSPDPTLDAKLEDQAVDGVVADSSDATGAKTDDKSLLSVVRDVVKEGREPSQSASPTEGDEDKDDDEKLKKADDEDYSDVPFHKHPKFQHLIHVREALKKEVAHLKVDADRYQNVQNFLDQSGLDPKEAADGLIIMGRAKTDPAGAWKQIQPWVQKLLIASGEVLPEDLKQRVSAGEMSYEAAMDLSRARATNESTKAAQSFREQQEARRNQESAANSLRSAAEEWARNRQSRDPNFAAKEQLLMKEVAYLHATEGRPNTPDGVKAQLAKAYKAVNESFRAPAPAPVRKPALRPVIGGQAAGEMRTEPKSVLDIVRANRRSA